MKKITFLLSGLLLLGACSEPARNYDLIPYPDSLTPQRGEFTAAGAPFTCDPQMDEGSKIVAAQFAAKLSDLSGVESTMTQAARASSGFLFLQDPELPAEGYRLDIARGKTTVRASALPGFLYAVQTLKQLLPTAIYGTQPAPEAAWVLPCVKIEDSPRFRYRGLMLDVARHFFDTAQVKKIIDVMVVHKLNTLHWHLTDDQGWRVEIKRYPELTRYGSIRKQTVIRKEWGHYDGTPYGGSYTQDEIRDVVAYATANGITVIPEIDLPGHMLAALACYPRLGCTGGPYKVCERWGVEDDVLCPGREETFTFIENVLTEIMELFPSEYIHIGGDECPKVRWEKCPRCQARIKELGIRSDDRYSAEHYLQSYVTARVETFLNAHGRRIIGWDEILEGELAENSDATVMSWRGSEGGIEAARKGHDAIMVPTSHFYFDYYQSRDVDNEPFGIGGYVPIEKVYSYEPYSETMPEEAKAHIIGVQANLWTEYIADNDHMEYMLLPRLAALSEVQWCRPERKQWTRVLESLPHITDIYRQMGLNFATTVFGVHSAVTVNPEKQCTEVTLTTQGDAPIHYTLDGTEPTAQSTRYTAPIEIREGCTLRARVLREQMQTHPYTQIFTQSKALGHGAVLNSAPSPKYLFDGAPLLTDGIESGFSYANGAWIGWLDEPLDVTIDMGGEQTYTSARLGTLVQKVEWIFPPTTLTASISDDNRTFTEVGQTRIPMETAKDADGLKSYTVTFPETSARYLRIRATTVDPIPAWHGARGQKAFLFADEIVVE